jgi:hypothetical protein
MPIIKLKLDRVFAHALCGSRFDGRLEHRQASRRKFRRLSRLLVGLVPGLVAQRAGAGIPQKGKGIMRLMPVFPLDVEPCAATQVHFHGLRVCHNRHEFSIAQQQSAAASAQKLPGAQVSIRSDQKLHTKMSGRF